MEVKQEERWKEYKTAASSSAAGAVRAYNIDAVRKAEKDVALTAKRASALVADPVPSPTDDVTLAADEAASESVTIHSDVDDEGGGAGNAAPRAVDIGRVEADGDSQLFQAGTTQ